MTLLQVPILKTTSKKKLKIKKKSKNQKNLMKTKLLMRKSEYESNDESRMESTIQYYET